MRRVGVICIAIRLQVGRYRVRVSVGGEDFFFSKMSRPALKSNGVFFFQAVKWPVR